MISILVAIVLSSNASGKTMVRHQPGTLTQGPAYSGPLIANDPGTVAHVVWNGTSLMDSLGNAWSMTGTVPQVDRSGKTPPGGGPYSTSNFYVLGSAESTVTHFAGDFSVCIVFKRSTGGTSPGLASTASVNVSGYTLSIPTGGGLALTTFRSGAASQALNAGTEAFGLSVACAGRSGSTLYAKRDLAAISQNADGEIVPGTAQAYLGRAAAASTVFPGIIYEAWWSTTPASDALFTAIMQRVKLRAQITAW